MRRRRNEPLSDRVRRLLGGRWQPDLRRDLGRAAAADRPGKPEADAPDPARCGAGGTNPYQIGCGACWADDGSLIYAATWGAPLQRTAQGNQKPTLLTRLDAAQEQRTHI